MRMASPALRICNEEETKSEDSVDIYPIAPGTCVRPGEKMYIVGGRGPQRIRTPCKTWYRSAFLNVENQDN